MPTQRLKIKKKKRSNTKKNKKQKKVRSKSKPTGLRPNKKGEKGERPKKKKKGQRLKTKILYVASPTTFFSNMARHTKSLPTTDLGI